MIVLLPTLESTRPFEGHGRTRSVFDRYHIVSAQDIAEAMERPAAGEAHRRSPRSPVPRHFRGAAGDGRAAAQAGYTLSTDGSARDRGPSRPKFPVI